MKETINCKIHCVKEAWITEGWKWRESSSVCWRCGDKCFGAENPSRDQFGLRTSVWPWFWTALNVILRVQLGVWCLLCAWRFQQQSRTQCFHQCVSESCCCFLTQFPCLTWLGCFQCCCGRSLLGPLHKHKHSSLCSLMCRQRFPFWPWNSAVI